MIKDKNVANLINNIKKKIKILKNKFWKLMLKIYILFFYKLSKKTLAYKI